MFASWKPDSRILGLATGMFQGLNLILFSIFPPPNIFNLPWVHQPGFHVVRNCIISPQCHRISYCGVQQFKQWRYKHFHCLSWCQVPAYKQFFFAPVGELSSKSWVLRHCLLCSSFIFDTSRLILIIACVFFLPFGCPLKSTWVMTSVRSGFRCATEAAVKCVHASGARPLLLQSLFAYTCF